jgi:protein-disulfide isomerase
MFIKNMTRETKILIGVGLFSILLVVGGVFLLTKSGSTGAPQSVVDQSKLITSDSYQTATVSAKVNIVEFGDYQCPSCAISHPVVKQVLKDYKDQVNLVWRNFPLVQHANALVSAEAAEAAGAQGKFWEMHDKLYDTQKSWAESSKPIEIFVEYAKELGLDTAKFESEITENKYKDKINNDLVDGKVIGINSTPTFFINGKRMPGIPTYADFKTEIDLILSSQ